MFLMPGSRARQRVIPPIAGTDIVVSRQSPGFRIAVSQTQLTASTSANIALNNTGTFFDGPTVAQGSSGTWFASGTITCNTGSAAGGDAIFFKLWDGATVMGSGEFHLETAAVGTAICASVSGVITNPAGNIRISVQDNTSSQGVLLANNSGLGKDSTVTAIRIA